MRKRALVALSAAVSPARLLISAPLFSRTNRDVVSPIGPGVVATHCTLFFAGRRHGRPGVRAFGFFECTIFFSLVLIRPYFLVGFNLNLANNERAQAMI